MTYRFRLRIATRQPGVLPFDTTVESISLAYGLVVDLVARNANTVAEATAFHFESGGFDTEQAARLAGERLRTGLRLLNAILGLGINVPTSDKISTMISAELRQKLGEQNNATVMDSVWGLAVFPDDGHHLEIGSHGLLVARPREPGYITAALRSIFEIDFGLDEVSEVALQILNASTQETSSKAAFLTCYLALEQLIERRRRSDAAVELIERFKRQLDRARNRTRAPLTEAESDSLSAVLNTMKLESFGSALMRFIGGLKEPERINGKTPRKFLSECIKARNRIAHDGRVDDESLAILTPALRRFVLSVIWTRNRIPPLSIPGTQSKVTVPNFSIRLF